MAKQNDETPGTPDPWAVLAQIGSALEAIAKRAESGPNEQLMVMQGQLTTALERLADANIKGSELIVAENKRAHRPSNEIAPGISVFNRRGVNLTAGEPGPRKLPLKCLMVIPWLVEWESSTREEVDLLNLIVEYPGEYVIRRADNSRVKITVQVELKVDNITPSRMLITHETAFNNDNFRLMPVLTDWLRQVLKQTDSRAEAAAILTDEEEEALIEARQLSTAA